MSNIQGKVKVATFKESGKFYDTFLIKYTSDAKNWYNVIDEIKRRKDNKELPQSDFTYVLLVEDEDEYGFPHLIK